MVEEGEKDGPMKEIPGNVFPRRLDKPLPVASRAEGLWIVDSDGKRRQSKEWHSSKHRWQGGR